MRKRQRKPIIAFLAVLFTLHSTVFGKKVMLSGDEYLNQLSRTWPQIGKTFLIIVLIAGCMFGIVFLIMRKVKLTNLKQKDRQQSLARFEELAQKHGLELFEKELLKRILFRRHVEHFEDIFTSMTLFERSVEQEMELMKQKHSSLGDMHDKSETLNRIRLKLGYRDVPLERPLISTRELPVGQALSLRSVTDRPDETVIAKVALVNELEFLVKLLPREGESTLPVLRRGDGLACIFTRGGDAEYSFQTRVTGVKDEGAGVYTLDHYSQMNRRQLRGHVRIDVKLPLKFRTIRTAEGVAANETQQAQMMDISGGGLSFKLPVSLKAGDIISLNFDLPDHPFRGVAGKVVRIVELDTSIEQPVYKHQVAFLELEQPVREKIIRYVFEKQREDIQWH